MSQTGQYLFISSGPMFTTLTGDDAVVVSPTGNNIDILALDGGNNSGSTVSFSGDAGLSKLVLNVSDTTLNNMFVGSNAGNAAASNTQNMGIGIDCLSSITSGQRNAALGYQAGTSLQNGMSNVLMGRRAGFSITNGNSNVALGESALPTATSGSGNIAIGHFAGNNITTATNNVGIGTRALRGVTTGIDNTGVGEDVLDDLTTGDNNCAFGSEAGDNLLTGSGNILIGRNAGTNYTGAESNNIVLGGDGVLADSGAIRLGTNGTHTDAFMAGIAGNAIVTHLPVVVDTVTDQLGTVTLSRGVVVSDAAGVLSSITGTDGQVIIGATGAAPLFASLTSTDSSVSYTTGANALDLSVSFSGLTFSTDAGSANPTLGTIIIAGGSNMNTSGGAATVTVNLDNIVTISGSFTTTGGAVNVGTAAPANPFDIAVEQSVSGLIGISVQNTSAGANAGSQLQLIVEPATADPAVAYVVNGANTWSSGVDNSDSDIFKLTTGSSPSAGTEVITCTTAGVVNFPQYGTGIIASDSSGVLSSITGTDGQLIIGATGADPIFATLASADSSVTITGGANSLDLSVAFGTLTFGTDSGNANPAAGTITIAGGANIDTSGAASTVTVAVDPSFADNTFRLVDNGDPTKELAFEVSAITGSTTRTITMPDRDVDLTNVAESFATDGAAATPSAGTITIAGGSNVTTSGAGATVTVAATMDYTGLDFNGDSGTANPAADAITIAGGANIDTSAAAATVTIAVDPEFADNTFRIVDNGDSSKELAFEVAAITTLTTRTITMPDRDVDLTDVAESFATDGAAAAPSAGIITIAGGTNVTTSGSGSTVTIDASGGGLTWNEETGTSATMAVDNGYIANNAGLVTLTLPSTAALGDVVRVTGKGAGGWRIAQNSGQTIYFGSSSTTTGTGGRLDSTAQRDTVELVCVTANNDFNVISSIGTITVT